MPDQHSDQAERELDETERARAAEADELAERGEQLDSEIEHARTDFKRKQADLGVPGADTAGEGYDDGPPTSGA